MMRNIIIICILSLCPLLAKAQQTFNMGGTVYDETGQTMPGANVYLKDRAGVGTTTDMNGNFKIRASKGDVIVFTFIGYKDVEYRVEKEDAALQINFSDEAVEIDEVVVTGMGSQRKVSVVGAITSVNVSEIQTPATSVTNMMGGRVPGIISLQTSGEPGKNIAEFWVRGISTFGAGSQALVLIDGLEGDINSIDPADIESFSILKDASATAVYGVRGANGVILVTTKRGQSGRLSITARANWTLSNLNRMPEYLRAYEYAKLANEARTVRGNEPIYDQQAMELIQYGLDPDLYPDVSWQDEIMKRQGFQQTYYLSGRGGGDVARYFVSMGLSNEAAAYKLDKANQKRANVGYNTYNYRLNLDVNITKSTTLYFGSDGYLTIQRQPGLTTTNSLWNAQSQLTPLTIPTRYSNGQLPAFGPNDDYSPYVMLNYTGMGAHQNFTGKSTVAVTQDFSFLLEGLKLKVQGAYDNKSYFSETRYQLPEMFGATGRNVRGELQTAKRVDAVTAQYGHAMRQYRKFYMDANLTWEKVIATDHRVTGLVHYEMTDQKDTYDILTSGITSSMAAIPRRYQGISSRITYGFKDTYNFDVNFGYTGSENFQPGRQFGFFPSFGVGWVPTQYQWVREKMPWLTFLKLRGTYGIVGNDRMAGWRFPYLTLVSETASTAWQGTGFIFGGITETSIGADNLMWEKAVKSDIGLEGRLFNDKVTFVVDIFQDVRDGIFQRRAQIPSYAGLLAMPYGNVGEMRSYGADGNVSYTHAISDDMNFTVRGNFTYSRNEVGNWEQAPQRYSYQEFNGYPSGAIRGYIATGLFRDEQDVASSPVQTFGSVCLPGDIKYKDVNGDGRVDTDDQVPLSDPTYPRLMYGFGGEFRYKNFTVGILFKGTGNTDFYHVGYYFPNEGYYNGMGYVPFHGAQTGNALTIVADQKNRWTPASYSGDPSTENPNARFPRLDYGYNANNSQLSTWWKGNSRYLRLQEITLNYNLKRDFLRKVGISSVDLQVVGSNLYVWDKVDLWDPEQAQYNGRAYPIPARYTFQVYLNF